MEGDNDDDEKLSFITLKAATLNVVEWLRKTHKEKTERDEQKPDTGHGDEQKRSKHRCNVDCELQKERTAGK